MTSSLESTRATARTWPESVQRRGAVAAATLAILFIPGFTRVASGTHIAWTLCVLAVSLAVIALLQGPGTWRDGIASRPTPRAMLAGLALGLVTTFVSLSLTAGFPHWFSTAPAFAWQVYLPPPPAGLYLFMFLILGLAGPILEEWLFRGVLWHALRRWCGPGTTTLATAVVFTLDHSFQRAHDFPLLFCFGLLLGWLRHRSGSLSPGLLAHSIYNLGVTSAAYYGIGSLA